jgi:hypothetical protein
MRPTRHGRVYKVRPNNPGTFPQVVQGRAAARPAGRLSTDSAPTSNSRPGSGAWYPATSSYGAIRYYLAGCPSREHRQGTSGRLHCNATSYLTLTSRSFINTCGKKQAYSAHRTQEAPSAILVLCAPQQVPVDVAKRAVGAQAALGRMNPDFLLPPSAQNGNSA